MQLSNVAVSLIRTWVPAGIGVFIVWLGKTLGIDWSLDENQIAAVTGFVISLYYSLIRIAERRWTWVGWLLGVPKQPEYKTPPPPVAEMAEE